MKVVFSKTAEKQFNYWKKKDPNTHQRILNLLKAIASDPFKGIGKPEPLKHQYQGYWSRRINLEHRLVYKVERETIFVAACRFHY